MPQAHLHFPICRLAVCVCLHIQRFTIYYVYFTLVTTHIVQHPLKCTIKSMCHNRVTFHIHNGSSTHKYKLQFKLNRMKINDSTALNRTEQNRTGPNSTRVTVSSTPILARLNHIPNPMAHCGVWIYLHTSTHRTQPDSIYPVLQPSLWYSCIWTDNTLIIPSHSHSSSAVPISHSFIHLTIGCMNNAIRDFITFYLFRMNLL